MRNDIHIANFVAACVELDAILVRPREVDVLSGLTFASADLDSSWRGIGTTETQAWRGGSDVLTSARARVADVASASAANPLAYRPAGGALGAVTLTETLVVLAERNAASGAAQAAGEKSARYTDADAYPNQLQAKTRAFMRRHPNSRGPSPTEPPV